MYLIHNRQRVYGFLQVNYYRLKPVALNTGLKPSLRNITKNMKRLAVGLHRSYKNSDFGSAAGILKSSPKGEVFFPFPEGDNNTKIPPLLLHMPAVIRVRVKVRGNNLFPPPPIPLRCQPACQTSFLAGESSGAWAISPIKGEGKCSRKFI